MFKEVLKTTGSAKLAALSKIDDTAKTVLIYAYNDQKYYISGQAMLSDAKATRGTETLYTTPWTELLTDLNERVITGGLAKERVKAFIRTLNHEHALIFTGILDKNLRLGIGKKSIDTVFPGLIDHWPGVMLAKVFSDSMFYPELMWSIKYDGLRGYYKDGNFYTRTGKLIKGISHLVTELPETLQAQELDGELTIPTKLFNEASGAIRSDADTPDAVYNIFDIPSLADKSFSDRYAYLRGIVFDKPHVKLVKHVTKASLQDVYTTFEKVLNAGYEGLMAKSPTHRYTRKRSSDWLKLKVTDNFGLCEVLATFPGTGLCKGIGGIVVRNEFGVEVKVGSGFSDYSRIQFQEHPEYIVGKTISINYHELTPDKSFRCPRIAKSEGL